MSDFNGLWTKLAKSKRYREEFAAAQVKRGIPFQIRRLLKQKGLTQSELAAKAGVEQGVVSRAADPEYGNLTLNTIIRIAAGFDVAFVGRFVPFSELTRWWVDLPSEKEIKTFAEEDAEFEKERALEQLRNRAWRSLSQEVAQQALFLFGTDTQPHSLPEAAPLARIGSNRGTADTVRSHSIEKAAQAEGIHLVVAETPRQLLLQLSPTLNSSAQAATTDWRKYA